MMKLSVPSRPKVALIALVAAAAPFAGISSAEATTSLWGCDVTPEQPVFDHMNPANGDKVIRYDVTVDCDAGRTITFVQEIREEDSANNYTLQTSNTRSRTFSSTDTVNMGWLLTLRNNDVSSAEEQYHAVKFKVVTTNLSESGWTSFERSPVQSFTN